MKRLLAIGLCFGVLGVAAAGATPNPAGLSREEKRRMTELQERLCCGKRAKLCLCPCRFRGFTPLKSIIFRAPASGI